MAGWYLMPHNHHLALHIWCRDYALTTMIPLTTDCLQQRKGDGILLTPGNTAQEDWWRIAANGTNIWLRWRWGTGRWWHGRQQPLVGGGVQEGRPWLTTRTTKQEGQRGLQVMVQGAPPPPPLPPPHLQLIRGGCVEVVAALIVSSNCIVTYFTFWNTLSRVE